MSNKTTAWIHRIYGCLLCLSLLVAALCLMGACLGIYDSGNGEFTREIVAEAFSPIAIPVYLCLLLALLGFPLHWFLPRETQKLKGSVHPEVLLQRLHSKTDLSGCSEELQNAVAHEAGSRKRNRMISLALLGMTFLVFLVYVLTGDRFLLPDITTSMKQAMLVLLPCLAVTFSFSIYAQYSGVKSVARETELMKQAKKLSPAQDNTTVHVETHQNLAILRGAILLLAVAVLLFGYCTGGTGDVLTKAINICTECVGLG